MRRALAFVLFLLVIPGSAAAQSRGRDLFVQGCSSCHGFGAHGVPGVGPDLHGVGEEAADFYLRTGRMPLDVATGEQPLREKPAYSEREIRAIVAYIGSLGGPRVPKVEPDAGNLSQGQRAFTTYCAGCHQIMGEGGVVTGAAPPDLEQATPTQVAEAVRVGPYVMPAFDSREIDQRTLNSIALYVRDVVQKPPNRGGWGIGNIGPVPEGMIAWLLAGGVLVLVVRVIGERMER